MTIPTHDYNMLDNRDELSIRRFMDFIYPNSDGELTYLSDTDNFSVLKDKIYPYQSDMDDLSVVKKKNVGFTKQAVDYKNKRPKLVNYTASAYKYRHFMGKSVIIPLPFDSTKLLDIIPHKYDKISLGGERVNFDYEPEQRVSSRPMVKFTKLGLEYRILNKVYTTKAINRVIKIEYYAT
jgi:hypothetical protein